MRRATYVTRNTRKQVLVSRVRGLLEMLGAESRVEWNEEHEARRVDLDRLDERSLESLNRIVYAALEDLRERKGAR